MKALFLKVLRPAQARTDWLAQAPMMSIQIDVTNACNLSCAHCYHTSHANSGALGLGEWQAVLCQYEELLRTLGRSPNIIICGGEPTLCRYLIDLLDWISAKFIKPPVTILTNGTYLTPNLLDAFVRHQVSIQVSLDGPSAESHNMVRGPRAFERMIANIQVLRDNGLKVALLAILSKRTSGQIPEFFSVAKELRVQRMKFTRFVPTGAGEKLLSDGSDRPLTAAELKTAYMEILDQSRKMRIATNSNKALFHLLDPRLGENEQFGFNGLVIDYKGNMKVSSRLPVLLGNVLAERPIKEVFFKNRLMRDLRNPKKHECGRCGSFRRCGGGKNAAWAATGSLFKKDPGCWMGTETKNPSESEIVL
jgi:radical SAM protein with 4Fe4S-binding SPASM domain